MFLCRCIILRSDQTSILIKNICKIGYFRSTILGLQHFAIPHVGIGIQCHLSLHLLLGTVSEIQCGNIDLCSGGIQQFRQFHTINIGVRFARLFKGKFCSITVTSRIEEVQVYGLTVGTGHILIVLIQNTGNICLCGSLRRICHIRSTHNTQCGYGILLNVTCGLIHAPSHDVVTGAGHCQVAGTIYIERAVSGEEILGAVADYEEVVSGDHDIKGVASRLCGTLCGNGSVDSSCLNAQTDLLGIGTADTSGSVGTTGLLCGLAHQFTESHGTGFVSCCVDVGNIITDYVHSGLVCLKSCHARIQ